MPPAGAGVGLRLRSKRYYRLQRSRARANSRAVSPLRAEIPHAGIALASAGAPHPGAARRPSPASEGGEDCTGPAVGPSPRMTLHASREPDEGSGWRASSEPGEGPRRRPTAPHFRTSLTRPEDGGVACTVDGAAAGAAGAHPRGGGGRGGRDAARGSARPAPEDRGRRAGTCERKKGVWRLHGCAPGRAAGTPVEPAAGRFLRGAGDPRGLCLAWAVLRGGRGPRESQSFRGPARRT